MTNDITKQGGRAVFDESAASNGGGSMDASLAHFENAPEKMKELAGVVAEICKQAEGLGEKPALDFAQASTSDVSGPGLRILKLHIPVIGTVPLEGETNPDFESGARSVTGRVTIMQDTIKDRLAVAVWGLENRLVISGTISDSPDALKGDVLTGLMQSNLLRLAQ